MKYQLLLDVESALQDIPNIKSLKIGLESGIGAKDCTFIRIVLEDTQPNSDNAFAEDVYFNVTFGFNISNIYSLKDIYQKTLDLEKQIKDRVEKLSYGITYQGTFYDGDNVQNMKPTAIRFKAESIGSC